MANVVVTVAAHIATNVATNIATNNATNVTNSFNGRIIREIQYLLCIDNVIDDLENEKMALTSERDRLKAKIVEAKERTEVIEEPVEKWLNDVENLLSEVEVLVQRTETDLNCFQGWFPTCSRYLLCKEMVKKIEAMEKFKGKSNDIIPFSHRAPLPGIQYHSSDDFIYLESTKMAYSQIWEALEDDRVSVIGLHGVGGCGKTALVTEVGKEAEKLRRFEKVISITVSRTPNIRRIQGEMADMLTLKLEEESETGRAQRLWLCLQNNKRILIIVDDLYEEFHLMHIGIRLDNVNTPTWKILITTPNEYVCTLMECQKTIPLKVLSNDESWTFFKKIAGIDAKLSRILHSLPQEICNECEGLPLTIKAVATSLKRKPESEWRQKLEKLRASRVSDDEGVSAALRCIKLCFDSLPSPETKLLFLVCCLFPENYHIPIEDVLRYTLGLSVGEIISLQSMRSLNLAQIKKLLESHLLMRGSVKMHVVVRDAALWIANRSEKSKILVNVDKSLSIVAEDDKIKDCFAVSSWWYNESPSFCQLHAPNLKILLLNISARGYYESIDLSHLTFEGIQRLEVFSLTINYTSESYSLSPSIQLLTNVRSLSPSIQLLTNVRTLRLNGLGFDDISFIGSLIRLEVLDLRHCNFNELPIEIGKLLSLKLLDLSECRITENTYNGAIRKCSQLEELYVSATYPEEYVQEISMDIVMLPNLQRFKFSDQIALKLRGCNISNLKASEKTILQIGKNISLTGLRGGCKNIIPDMVGIVGGMNDLSSLHLTNCQEMECIFDATYDFKEDDLIPNLIELHLESLENLTELGRGPTREVLPYFEKLEILKIRFCKQIHIIFPKECNLRNLKILTIYYCRTIEVLFSASVAQSLQQLEQLSICGCNELKHIIAVSGSNVGGNTSGELVQLPNAEVYFPKLNIIKIYNCNKLKSLFLFAMVKILPELSKLNITGCTQFEEVFRHGPGGDDIIREMEVVLPNLTSIILYELPNFVDICRGYKLHTVKLQELHINHCPKTVPSLTKIQDETQRRWIIR